MKLGASPKIEEVSSDDEIAPILLQSQQQLMQSFQAMGVRPYNGPFLVDLLEGANLT
jgi:hypothetical protein